jgi:hypothetical protein
MMQNQLTKEENILYRRRGKLAKRRDMPAVKHNEFTKHYFQHYFAQIYIKQEKIACFLNGNRFCPGKGKKDCLICSQTLSSFLGLLQSEVQCFLYNLKLTLTPESSIVMWT